MRYTNILACLLLSVTSLHAGDALHLSDQDYIGVVTLCGESSVVYRDGHAYHLTRGSGVRVEDEIEVGASGPIAVVLGNDSAVTFQAHSKFQIGEASGERTVHLFKGEARVTHDGSRRLWMTTPDVGLKVGRAIVRLQRRGDSTYVENVAGTATLVAAEISHTLRPQDIYQAGHRGVAAVQSPVDWSIDAEQVRLASAVQAQPPLQLPNLPGSGAPPANRGSNAPSDGNAVANNSNKTAAELEEERRRRLQIQQPQPAGSANRGNANTQPTAGGRSTQTSGFTGSSSLSLGSFSGSTSGFSSGGLASDANQQTFQGQLKGTDPPTPFPGQVHLVTAETKNSFPNIQLNAAEQAALGANSYYSIGVGAPPTGQVVTDANTASNPTPTAIGVAQFDAHVVKLDQYGAVDSALDPNGALNSNAGITGLVGVPPTGPTIVGTAPLVDTRAAINQNATFALGEFRVSVDSTTGAFSLAARSSDQDRTIIKDANGNDANDIVATNPDVQFTDVTDPRFLPQASSVKVPVANHALNNRATSYSDLSTLRRAAFTTVMADSLKDYATRTGQTRFVVNGQIVDISGYKP